MVSVIFYLDSKATVRLPTTTLAFLSPSFSYDMCAHFVRYEGAVTNAAIGIVGLMMILRCEIFIYSKQHC